jgi:hypothetical protein
VATHLQTKELLESQRARLRAAVRVTACQYARTNALQLLTSVNDYLSMGGDLSCVAGMIGPNGMGPAIDHAIRDCEAHTRDAEVAAIVAGSRRAAA